MHACLHACMRHSSKHAVSHLQSMCQEENCEVAVQGVGVFPEGTGVERSGGIQLHMAPTHQASFH